MPRRFAFALLPFAALLAARGAVAEPLPTLPFDAPVAISLGSELGAIDLADESPATREVWPLVFETLFRRAPDGSIVPSLAEALELRDDALQATIRLRRDVVFHDGAALTADDVVASLRRAKAARGGWLLAPITTIARAGDDVSLTLSRPTPNLSALLTALVTAITPDGKAPTAEHAIGAGPYIFRAPAQLVRNPHYVGKVPALNTLVLHALDPAANWHAYTSDATLATHGPAGLPLSEDENATKSSRATTTIFLLGGQTLETAALHKLGLAIDRTRLAIIVGGKAALNATPAIYGVKEKAKAWPAVAAPHATEGATLASKMELLIDGSQAWMRDAAENILTDLAAANIALEIVAASSADYRARRERGAFTLLLGAALTPVDDAQICALDLVAQTDEKRAALLWSRGMTETSSRLIPLAHVPNQIIVKPQLAGVRIDATGAVSWQSATFK